MRKMAQISSVLTMFLSLPLALGQKQGSGFSLRGIYERGLQRSDLPMFLQATRSSSHVAYFVDVIRQAGGSSDPFWIPYLRPLLNRKGNPGNDVGGAAQLALAKLGEAQPLQEIACEANLGSARIQDQTANDKLPYVGGWFSSRLLAGWLDEGYKYEAILQDKPGGDEIFSAPQELALMTLPKILNQAQIPPPLPIWIETRNQEKLAPLRQAWREWISNNETSINKLPPSMGEIDVSRSTCKRVLAHDRHFDRSGLARE